jgi:SAM-dependent methyltransferase
MNPPPGKSEFDQFAADYDGALAQGISVSGEDKKFFARGRIMRLEQILRQKNLVLKSALDFGCGTGQAAPLLKEIVSLEKILGVDVSEGLLGVAQREHGGAGIEFRALKNHQPAADFDLAFCNGVFHHIPPAERCAAVNHVFRTLKPGGFFALWENNPWNPGTCYVMSRIPFDRDAITLSPPTARQLLRAGGFEILRTDFQFFFPRCLKWLRGLEPLLAKIPLGAQYQVLARKPGL